MSNQKIHFDSNRYSNDFLNNIDIKNPSDTLKKLHEINTHIATLLPENKDTPATQGQDEIIQFTGFLGKTLAKGLEFKKKFNNASQEFIRLNNINSSMKETLEKCFYVLIVKISYEKTLNSTPNAPFLQADINLAISKATGTKNMLEASKALALAKEMLQPRRPVFGDLDDGKTITSTSSQTQGKAAEPVEIKPYLRPAMKGHAPTFGDSLKETVRFSVAQDNNPSTSQRIKDLIKKQKEQENPKKYQEKLKQQRLPAISELKEFSASIRIPPANKVDNQPTLQPTEEQLKDPTYQLLMKAASCLSHQKW